MFLLQYFQVQAEDPDAGQNGTVVYKIGANTGPFQINPFSELILHVVVCDCTCTSVSANYTNIAETTA